MLFPSLGSYMLKINKDIFNKNVFFRLFLWVL